MRDRHEARTPRGRGEVQYSAIASPITVSGSAVLPPPSPAPRAQPRPFLGILQEVGHRGAAEGVDEAVHHGRPHPTERAALLQAVEGTLLPLAAHRDEVLVHEAVQRGRHARVGDVARAPHRAVDFTGRRLADLPQGPDEGELEVPKFHGRTMEPVAVKVGGEAKLHYYLDSLSGHPDRRS